MNSENRVVVTGMGVVSPVGIGRETFFNHLLEGRSGIDRIRQYDPSNQLCRIAGEVTDFKADDYFDKKCQKRTGRYTQFATIAANEAIDQSGIDFCQENPSRTSVVISSAIGDFLSIDEQVRKFYDQGPGRMNPFTVPRVSSNMASACLSIQCKLQGPGFGLSSACATGSHSITLGYLLLKLNLSDVALTGGTDASICPSYVESYIALRALSRRNEEPTCASRPFDRDRDGFVIGEGAGVMILETLAHAKKRRADILAEIIGCGMSCDAYHITAPDPEGSGAALAIQNALAYSQIPPETVDYINAHGTATLMNDPMETKAIKKVFGEHAYHIPVSSTKSMIGHCISAAGALEAIVSVMTLARQVIHPTINLDHPDPECDLNYVPNQPVESQIKTVMSNSFAFGGQNCVLVFKKWE